MNQKRESIKLYCQVTGIILKASRTSLKLKQIKRRIKLRKVSDKKWFDKDCKMKRSTLRKLSNQKHRDPLNISIRESYHITLREYKQLLALKQNAFHDEKIEQLKLLSDTSGSNSFGEILKSMNDTIK